MLIKEKKSCKFVFIFLYYILLNTVFFMYTVTPMFVSNGKRFKSKLRDYQVYLEWRLLTAKVQNCS